MKTNRSFVLVLSILLLFSLITFVRPEMLMIPISEDPPIPLGTTTSWIALSFPSLIAFVLFKKHFDIIPIYFQVLIFLGLLLGVPWGVVGRIMSGNWAFEFVNIPASSQRFWIYTYGDATIQFFVMVAVPLLFNWVRKKKNRVV